MVTKIVIALLFVTMLWIVVSRPAESQTCYAWSNTILDSRYDNCGYTDPFYIKASDAGIVLAQLYPTDKPLGWYWTGIWNGQYISGWGRTRAEVLDQLTLDNFYRLSTLPGSKAGLKFYGD